MFALATVNARQFFVCVCGGGGGEGLQVMSKVVFLNKKRARTAHTQKILE